MGNNKAAVWYFTISSLTADECKESMMKIRILIFEVIYSSGSGITIESRLPLTQTCNFSPVKTEGMKEGRQSFHSQQDSYSEESPGGEQ